MLVQRPLDWVTRSQVKASHTSCHVPPDSQCAHTAHVAGYLWHHLLLVSKAPKLRSTMTHSLCSQTRPSCPVCLSSDCPAFSDIDWPSPGAQPDVCAPSLLLTFSCVPPLPVGPSLSEPTSFLLLPLFGFL